MKLASRRNCFISATGIVALALSACSDNAQVVVLSAVPSSRSTNSLLAFDIGAGALVKAGKFDVATGKQDRSCFFSINPVILFGPNFGIYALPPGTYLVEEDPKGGIEHVSYVVRLSRGERKFIGSVGAPPHAEVGQDGVPALLREKGFTKAVKLHPSQQMVLGIGCSF